MAVDQRVPPNHPCRGIPYMETPMFLNGWCPAEVVGRTRDIIFLGSESGNHGQGKGKKIRLVNYHLVMTMENPNHKSRFLAGKNIYFYGPFSMAMLNNQRVL